MINRDTQPPEWHVSRLPSHKFRLVAELKRQPSVEQEPSLDNLQSIAVPSPSIGSSLECVAEGDAEMVALEFTFAVPECEPGSKVQVAAPGGAMLLFALPKNALPGDTVVMTRADESSAWRFHHLIRPDAPVEYEIAPLAVQEKEWLGAEQIQLDLMRCSVPVILSTTKGDVRLFIVPKWSPRGAQRFLDMIDNDFYSQGIAVYRAVPDFLVQFGVAHGAQPFGPIYDDPLIGVPVEVGSVLFAAVGPDSRKHTMCIFLESFPQLGMKSTETPIGKVADVSSMDIVRSLFSGYGDIPQAGGQGPDPEVLEERGNQYILDEFPSCDFITGARRVPDKTQRVSADSPERIQSERLAHLQYSHHEGSGDTLAQFQEIQRYRKLAEMQPVCSQNLIDAQKISPRRLPLFNALEHVSPLQQAQDACPEGLPDRLAQPQKFDPGAFSRLHQTQDVRQYRLVSQPDMRAPDHLFAELPPADGRANDDCIIS